MAADGPSGGSSGGPTGGSIAIRRARWILIVAAGIWAAAAAATVLWINPSLTAAELEAGPPVWLTWATPLFVGLFSAAGAWRLRPGDRSGWGLAVSAMALNLLSCVFPAAVYGVYLLFKPAVKATLLGGHFAEGQRESQREGQREEEA